MKYILLPETETTERHKLPFYFAIEEYVARQLPNDEYFFIWQVGPTVMLGRNQLINNEVDTEYCKAHGIDIFRRKSGGGCVYADKGCLQFSYIKTDNSSTYNFKNYIHLITEVMNDLGFDAGTSGRNDVIIGDKKVAGAAFYRMGNKCVMHNTLLHSTDLNILSRCLTPANEKLESKGVSSVQQRVANITDFRDISIDEIVSKARAKLCGEDYIRLTDNDLTEIKEIEQRLSSNDFVYGNNPGYSVVRRLRIEDVGTLEARIELKNEIITRINLLGDYFLLGDLDRELLDKLRGLEFTRDAVYQVLYDINIERVILNLKMTQFLRLLFGPPTRISKPEWLKISHQADDQWAATNDIIRGHALHTICTSGRCPNKAECWRAGTATLMIGGDICTRSCRFCNTKSGRPAPLNSEEPLSVAESVAAMKLRYAVITSVDRDDLPDLGAKHWAETINAIRKRCPNTMIEVLIPDFQGKTELLDIVLNANPHIVAHNMETVRRLTPTVRSVATYDKSLAVLEHITKKGFVSKTGIMVGLGETKQEVIETFDDLRRVGCKIITIGQYLQPTLRHLPVKEYVTPKQFDEYKEIALQKGFEQVESAPLVRSSYHAERYLMNKKKEQETNE